jgi:hypothetical protein
MDQVRATITRRTGAECHVGTLRHRVAATKQQVARDFLVPADSSGIAAGCSQSVAGGDNQRHVFVVTPSTRPQIGYSYRVALLDSH